MSWTLIAFVRQVVIGKGVFKACDLCDDDAGGEPEQKVMVGRWVTDISYASDRHLDLACLLTALALAVIM